MARRRVVAVDRQELAGMYGRRGSPALLLYALLRFLVIILQNIYLVSTYLILTWFILMPIHWLRAELYSRLENYLYNFLLLVVSSWGMGAGITVVESGDEYKHLIEGPRFLEPAGGGGGGGELLLDNDLKPTEHADRDHNNQATPAPSPLNNHTPSPQTNHLSKTNHQQQQQAMQPPLAAAPKEPAAKPKVLLLCNHISTADVLLIMQSFSEMTSQSNLWVLDAAFKLTNFGLVCSSHGDFFIAKNSFKDGLLRDQTLKHPDRNLLVLFPEGGFWRKRLEGSNRFASKNNLPPTKYVTHPRFGAFRDFMDPSVGVTHIVDATLIYNDIKNPLSILDIVLGTKREPVLLNYKIYDRQHTDFTDQWLRNIWLEKDKLIEQYYDDRNKVYDKLEPTMRTFKMDWLKLFAVHLFYLLVFYLTVYRLFNATSVTMVKAKELYYSNI